LIVLVFNLNLRIQANYPSPKLKVERNPTKNPINSNTYSDSNGYASVSLFFYFEKRVTSLETRNYSINLFELLEKRETKQRIP
jgi:hypothetical protein